MEGAYLKNELYELYNMHYGRLLETNGFMLREKNDSVIIIIIFYQIHSKFPINSFFYA